MAEVKWEEFFKAHRLTKIQPASEHDPSISVEELYQAFKARLMDELMVDAPDLRAYGVLVSK